MTWRDALLVVGFSLLALLHHVGRWEGAYPFVPRNGFTYLSGDASNIVGFAMAWDHPELFRGDAILGESRNFRFYATIHIPLIQLLAKFTEDHAAAFISLLSIHVFLQALGFYVFGLVAFQSRYWATLLSVVTLMPVELNLGDFWGISEEPLPRFSFQALLPYLLAAAFYWKKDPQAWPWLMACAGVLIYVHPVSAPVWGLAIWLGLLSGKPSHWSFGRQFRYMLGMGALFLLVTLPWVAHYLRNHVYGVPRDFSYAQIWEIMSLRFARGTLDIPYALRHFVSLWRDEWVYWAWPVIGAALVAFLRRDNRRSVLVVALWIVGLGVGAVALPLLDHSVARMIERIPIELELVRGIRYTVPMTLFLCLWPLAEMTKKRGDGERNRIVKGMAYGIGGLLVAAWVASHRPATIVHAVECWAQGSALCLQWSPEEEWRPALPEVVEALTAVRRETPTGAKMLATDYGLQIRYYARRPLVYAWKDGAIFAYANHAGLVEWYEKYEAMASVRRLRDGPARLNSLVGVATKFGAEYLLIDSYYLDIAAVTDLRTLSWAGAELIWRNGSFALLKLVRV